MDDGIQFLDIILFAAIAAFFVLRLRGVLGKRTGHEKRPKYDPFAKPDQDEGEEDKVIPLPDRSRAAKTDQADEEATEAAEAAEAADETPLSVGLMQIGRVDKAFDEEQFLSGAGTAFEWIINAFAQGDTKALRPLLSNDVYGDFAGAIEEREGAGQILETTMVGITEAAIIEAELQGRTAFITIKFVSEQVNVVRDSDGEVVEGDPSHVTKITDIWTFARNTRSRDPDWTLVATRSPN
ncbi:MAG: Tim44 domain-containing protein [Proteobacteria bacterium]|nr:Tim44 domain-containing protein [Pseudomonadota bacterium]